MKLPFKRGLQLVKKAYEENDKDKYYQLWLIIQPLNQDGETLMHFETWYRNLIEENQRRMKLYAEPVDDILDLVSRINAKVGEKDANI